MIAGQRIKIQKADLEDCYGQYLHEKRIIQLHKKLPENEIIPTLRHEMLHAAFHISGISFCESFQEEACIRCIDEVFFPAYERILKRLKWKINQKSTRRATTRSLQWGSVYLIRSKQEQKAAEPDNGQPAKHNY